MNKNNHDALREEPTRSEKVRIRQVFNDELESIALSITGKMWEDTGNDSVNFPSGKVTLSSEKESYNRALLQAAAIIRARIEDNSKENI